jgi:ribosome recycling factor
LQLSSDLTSDPLPLPDFFAMDLEASMRKSVEATQRTFNTIRTGRANPSLLDKLSIDYYGADTPLKALATLSTPDSQTIQIQPFDRGSMALIEKAIAMSDLGLTPNNDGKVIRINIPPLTADRRKDFVKLASKYAEEGKVGLRNLRRDAIDKVKKLEKDGELSEDQSRDEQDKIQKLTDRYITEVEKHLADKEADILKV